MRAAATVDGGDGDDGDGDDGDDGVDGDGSGDNPAAMVSALTKRARNAAGNTWFAKLLLPAPFGPPMTCTVGIIE